MSGEKYSWSALKGDILEQGEIMSSTETASNNLDKILSQIGAKFGKYQLKNYVFIFIPVIFSALYTLSYIFTARNLDYRCHIPGCDTPIPQFRTPWLQNAIPSGRNHQPSRCQRYPLVSNMSLFAGPTCPAAIFNQSTTYKCDQFVFDTDEINIANDFGLLCEENLWKLTLVGTVNNIGQFVCLPIAGYVSDRFGRRFLMLGGLTLSAIIGILRSFSPTYLWFLLFEFLDPAVGSGAYSSGFILGVELVSPEKRVLSGTLISSCYAVGEAIVGFVAWSTSDWRLFLRYLYLPGLFLIAFFWLTPESVRWLLAKGRYEDVKKILREAAKTNKVEISENDLKSLEYQPPEKSPKETVKYPMKAVFKSTTLLLRLVNCSFCWITCNFVYYGLSLNSVAVAGNMYLNFISVALIEVPGYITTYLILDRFGRRLSLCGSLLLSGIACLTFIFLPEDATLLRLTVFLVGKFGITISFTVLYVFSTELFPTSLRHSLLGTCSMFGRTGSMVAPQTPLLAEIMESLPLILFGAMSVTSGMLVLLFPETLHTKLPDTIEEAEVIGKKETVTVGPV